MGITNDPLNRGMVGNTGGTQDVNKPGLSAPELKPATSADTLQAAENAKKGKGTGSGAFVDAFGKIKNLPALVEALKGQQGLTNEFLNIEDVMDLGEALMKVAINEAQKRFEAREESLVAMNWQVAEGLAQHDFILASGEIDAQMLEKQAAQHITNGIISAIGAGLTLASFAATTAGAAYQKRSGSEMNKLKQEAHNAQTELDVAKSPGMAPRTAAEAAGRPAPKTPEQIEKLEARRDASRDAVRAKSDKIDTNAANMSHMTTNVISQVTTAAREFTEAATKIELADLTRRKSYVDSFKKISETYEKVAQKLAQSADGDQRDFIENMKQALQAFDSGVRARLEAFKIGVRAA